MLSVYIKAVFSTAESFRERNQSKRDSQEAIVRRLLFMVIVFVLIPITFIAPVRAQEGDGADTRDTVSGKPQRVVIDILPDSCPNYLVFEEGVIDDEATVVPVAIIGSWNLDVAKIRPETVRLGKLTPIWWGMSDVATAPRYVDDRCHRFGQKPDGMADLVLLFDQSEVIAGLGIDCNREALTLIIQGELTDGERFEGIDKIVFLVRSMGAGGHGWGGEVVLGNYPNPFNPSTDISFSLPEASTVRLEVFNLLGQAVATVYSGTLGAGEHSFTWDGSRSPSGVYMYRLTAGEFNITKKMMLLK